MCWGRCSGLAVFRGCTSWPGALPPGLAAAACVILAAHFVRRSELKEVGPLRRSADIDPLTALHNQAFFRRAASRRITRAREYGPPLSLAMLDVDDFKDYNDAFGHEAGNAVLRLLAGVLRRSIRADDLVARYGRSSSCCSALGRGRSRRPWSASD